MKPILYLVPVLLLAGCVRDTTTDRSAQLLGNTRLSGEVMGQTVDLQIQTDLDASSSERSHYESKLNTEAIKEVVGPLVDAAIKAGLSEYLPATKGGLLQGYEDDATAGLLAALLGSHVISERRKKKRDEVRKEADHAT